MIPSKFRDVFQSRSKCIYKGIAIHRDIHSALLLVGLDTQVGLTSYTKGVTLRFVVMLVSRQRWQIVEGGPHGDWFFRMFHDGSR